MIEFVLLAAGAAIGAASAWYIARGDRKLDREQRQLALAERDEARAETGYVQRRLDVRDAQLARAKSERDDYAAIASTHEVDAPKWGQGTWARKVWKERRYSGHPADNLADLRGDFSVFGEDHILLRLDIELLGGWKKLVDADADMAGRATEPLSAGQALVLEGPAPRVLRQLSTFLCDDDTGFVDSAPDEPVRWRDPDSPMIWLLTVDVLQGTVGPDELPRVEVLRVQQEIVEKVVERPVVQALPPELTEKLCNHTSEELVSLIEAVLEVRELGPGAGDKALPSGD